MARKPKIAPPPADLAELDKVVEAQSTGKLIPILSFDGVSPLGFSIRVAGPDSPMADAARQMMQQELVDRESLEPLTLDERREQGMLYLSRITMGFEPAAILDGRQLQNTPEDALKLYRRFRFIYRQVDESAGKREDFLPEHDSPSPTQSESESEA